MRTKKNTTNHTSIKINETWARILCARLSKQAEKYIKTHIDADNPIYSSFMFISRSFAKGIRDLRQLFEFSCAFPIWLIQLNP